MFCSNWCRQLKYKIICLFFPKVQCMLNSQSKYTFRCQLSFPKICISKTGAKVLRRDREKTKNIHMKDIGEGGKARNLVKCKRPSANIDTENNNAFVMGLWHWKRISLPITVWPTTWWGNTATSVDLCPQGTSENATSTDVFWEAGACCKHHWEDDL